MGDDNSIISSMVVWKSFDKGENITLQIKNHYFTQSSSYWFIAAPLHNGGSYSQAAPDYGRIRLYYL